MSNSLRKNSHKSFWRIFLLFLVVCVGGVLTTLYVYKRTAKNTLDAKLGELESKGIPVDDASMAAYHASLNSNELTTQWTSVLDMISSKQFAADSAGLAIVSGQSPAPPMNQAWYEQQQAEQLLQKYSDQLQKLIAVAQDNGPVQMPIQFESFATLLPYSQNSRTLVRVLSLEAHVAARHGDIEREFRAINAMFGCSISLRGEPYIVSQLVSFALHGLAIDQLQNAVQLNRLKLEHYEQLTARLAQFSDIRKPFETALVGELGSMITAARDPQMLRHDFGAWASILVESGIADRAAVKHAEIMEKALKIEVDDLKQFLEQTQEIESGLVKSSKLAFSDQLANHYLPSIGSCAKVFIRHKLNNNMALLALSIRQYEQKHGKLPESLTELQSLGIDLDQFKTLDGGLPNYTLIAPETKTASPCRAVLWCEDFERTNAPIQPDMIDPHAAGQSRWLWFLK